MNFKQLFADDEAVSPVIGVILMVAITVILAAVIGTFVLGQADQLNENAPSVSFEYEGSSGSQMTVVHTGGDDFKPSNVEVQYEGATSGDLAEDWSGDGTAGGQHQTAESVTADQTLRVVWSSAEGGTSSEIGSYEVP